MSQTVGAAMEPLVDALSAMLAGLERNESGKVIEMAVELPHLSKVVITSTHESVKSHGSASIKVQVGELLEKLVEGVKCCTSAYNTWREDESQSQPLQKALQSYTELLSEVVDFHMASLRSAIHRLIETLLHQADEYLLTNKDSVHEKMVEMGEEIAVHGESLLHTILQPAERQRFQEAIAAVNVLCKAFGKKSAGDELDVVFEQLIERGEQIKEGLATSSRSLTDQVKAALSRYEGLLLQAEHTIQSADALMRAAMEGRDVVVVAKRMAKEMLQMCVDARACASNEDDPIKKVALEMAQDELKSIGIRMVRVAKALAEGEDVGDELASLRAAFDRQMKVVQDLVSGTPVGKEKVQFDATIIRGQAAKVQQYSEVGEKDKAEGALQGLHDSVAQYVEDVRANKGDTQVDGVIERLLMAEKGYAESVKRGKGVEAGRKAFDDAVEEVLVEMGLVERDESGEQGTVEQAAQAQVLASEQLLAGIGKGDAEVEAARERVKRANAALLLAARAVDRGEGGEEGYEKAQQEHMAAVEALLVATGRDASGLMQGQGPGSAFSGVKEQGRVLLAKISAFQGGEGVKASELGQIARDLSRMMAKLKNGSGDEDDEWLRVNGGVVKDRGLQLKILGTVRADNEAAKAAALGMMVFVREVLSHLEAMKIRRVVKRTEEIAAIIRKFVQ